MLIFFALLLSENHAALGSTRDVNPDAKAEVSHSAMTLQETVQYALKNAPTLDSAQKAQTIGTLEYQNSIAKMLPSLDVNTTNGIQNTIPLAANSAVLTSNPSSPWYSSFTLGITENLYDNGETLIRTSIANLNRDYTALSYLKNRDTLTLDVMTEFYNFSKSNILLEVTLEQQGILNKQFKTVSSQYEQGLKTKIDFLRLKTQVQRAEISRLTAENTIRLSTIQLRKLIGVDPENAQPPDFLPLAVKPAPAVLNLFPSQSPDFQGTYDYKLSQIQKQMNEQDVQLSQRRYWPQVTVGSGVSYTNFNYINSNAPLFGVNDQVSWNALLTLQYNFWDWGIRKHDVQIAQYNRDIQDNSVNQLLLNTSADLKSLMSEIARLGRSYQLSQELLSMEEQSYKNMEALYQDGKVTYLDLITSLNSLLGAKTQFYSFYFDALLNRAHYSYYEGTVRETLNQQ